jgi:predicted unusual protein kinase regulating ubiquinone biosynthesis (AarF/ABC1/UbiB family)
MNKTLKRRGKEVFFFIFSLSKHCMLGNILVRKNPSHTGSFFDRNPKHELILLDHGLYIEESPEFRVQYCELWKAMFLLDLNKVPVG